MSEWKEYKLGELCEIKGGKRLPLGHELVTEKTKHPYIKARDIKNGKISTENLEFVTENTHDLISRYIVRQNDVCLTIVANIGDVGIVPKELDFANLTENAIRLTSFKNSVNSKYLNYLLSSNTYKKYCEGLAAGAAQAKLGIYKIKTINIKLPSLPEQLSIASILSAYDELIENNNRRIALLEQTAEQIYNEWFVRLRFPGYENAEFEKGVPKGWEWIKIGDICKVARGSSPRPITDNQYFINGTIPWIKIADATASSKFILETKEYVNEYGASFSRYLNEGSLIIATSGTLGFCIFLGIKGCVHDGWLYTTDYKRNIKPSFLYFVINSLKDYYNNLSYGAAIQNINTEILRKTPLLLPAEKVLKKFYEIIEPIDLEHKNLLKQTQNLKQTRDLLLPRLISGKLRVKDIEN